MSGLNHNLNRTHGFEPLRVEGMIPNELRGTLYRAGPGLVERFGKSVHPFLADGAITAVHIGDDIQGACRIVESDKYLEEERLGHSLYDPNASLFRRIRNGLSRTIKNTGNTNVLAWQGRLFALMEAGKPVEMAPHTLDTKGTTDLGIVKTAFSAHPHRVDVVETTFNFGLRGKHIDLFALPDNGVAKLLTTFEAPWASLVHDFIVTDKHAIFFIDPSKLVLWRVVLGLKDFSRYFYWDSQESTTIITIPLNNPDKQYRFEVDPFRVWHFANAYEEGENIVIDACRHDDIRVLSNPTDTHLTETSSNDAEPELWRFRITPKHNSFSGEPMWRFPCEFPMVHPCILGTEHRYIWVQTYNDDTGNGGFARIDTKTQQEKRWYTPDNHLGSEPIFVPRKDQEGEGWILQLIQDTTLGKSYVAIVDSKRMEDEPLAKLWFDHAIPATFHGVFIRESRS